ncbi:MAG TPA: NTP transferase domain-containing protein [Pseudolysinimonas sp.]
MDFDAVVLSGGRASRLGGVAKAGLEFQGVPLLQRAIDACDGAQWVVVVGDGAPGLPQAVRVVREAPAFAGPAAALGAGIAALARGGAPELVLVLACDMPSVADVVGDLLAAAAAAPTMDGVMATDESGRAQYLAAVYRVTPLGAALRKHEHGSGLDGLSMRALLSDLRLAELTAPRGSTADIDDWDDAERLGVTVPSGPLPTGEQE